MIQAIESVKNSIYYKPHDGQKRFHRAEAVRYRICCMGRRWGKSIACIREIVRHGRWLPNTKYWWVAPTYPQGKATWDLFFEWVPKSFIAKVNIQLKEITLDTGSTIQWKSADSPDSLVGTGLDGMVVDEGPLIPKIIWDRNLKPTLIDKRGWAVVIGTPRGRNWFYQLHVKARSELNTDHEALHYPTTDNPYLPADEFIKLKEDMTDDMYKQEIMAEFLEDNSGVFHNIKETATAPKEDHNPNEIYIMGVDLAKKQDFTVLSVMKRRTKEIVNHERFNKIDWGFQKQKIISKSDEYRAPIWLDSTGVGDPILDDLKRHYAGQLGKVQGYQYTEKSKVQLIENYVIGFDKKALRIPKDPVYVQEHESFEYKMMPSGKIRYSAPEGLYDDCVNSGALAYWGSTRPLLLAG